MTNFPPAQVISPVHLHDDHLGLKGCMTIASLSYLRLALHHTQFGGFIRLVLDEKATTFACSEQVTNGMSS
jgi:hypothetical protein